MSLNDQKTPNEGQEVISTDCSDETGKHSCILSVHVAPLAKDSDTVVEQGNDNWSGEI